MSDIQLIDAVVRAAKRNRKLDIPVAKSLTAEQLNTAICMLADALVEAKVMDAANQVSGSREPQ